VNLFRPAREAPRSHHLMVTLAQTSVFWGVFLVALPAAILRFEFALGIPSFSFAAQHAVAAVLAVSMGVLNLGSGVTMALAGRGTPLPTSTARELVVRGPYRFVRNPMAIGGLGVGVALGLAYGSWGVVAYSVSGGVAWHLVARPMEERDLLARFGEDYAHYRSGVRNWVPRLSAYRPVPK